MKVYVVIGANNFVNKKGFKSIEEAHDCIGEWLIDHAGYFSENEITKGITELKENKTITHFGDIEMRIVEIEIED